MGKCRCGDSFQDGWEWLCPTCDPRKMAVGMVQANFKDGSKPDGKGMISQRYYESLQKRKAKKSKETIAAEHGEI